MINTNNIKNFISFLYQHKKGQIAPPELLHKWGLLSNEEIQVHLNGLFETWQYTKQQATQLKQQFLASVPSSFTTATIAPAQAPRASIVKVRSSNKWLARLAAIAVLLPLGYIIVKWVQYEALAPVYAITDNIAVRNEAAQQVYRMDLKAPAEASNVPSIQSLRALDAEVYERSIDSSGKIKQHRMVLMPTVTFAQYLLSRYEKMYVNANLVVEDEAEFLKYQSAFKGLSYEEAYVIELRYRKVIVKCLQMDKGMDNLYITTSCMTGNKPKGLHYFAMQELKKDAVYAVVAKMNDGNYYKFIGDLRANSYTRPVKVGYMPKPISADELLQGDMLFKVQGSKVSLYTCAGTALNYKSVPDTYNSVSHFEKVVPVQAPKDNSILEDLGDMGKDILDAAADKLSNGVNTILDATIDSATK